jgi:hypothetical protein
MRVIQTCWTHIWRLRSLFFRTKYDSRCPLLWFHFSISCTEPCRWFFRALAGQSHFHEPGVGSIHTPARFHSGARVRQDTISRWDRLRWVRLRRARLQLSFSVVSRCQMLFFTACVCLRIWPQSCVVWLPVARFFLWFFCCSNQIEPGSPDLDSSSFDFASSYCVWIVTGTHLSIAFESSDQKTWEFVVQIALSRWFFEHAYQVFGEMSVRI